MPKLSAAQRRALWVLWEADGPVRVSNRTVDIDMDQEPTVHQDAAYALKRLGFAERDSTLRAFPGHFAITPNGRAYIEQTAGVRRPQRQDSVSAQLDDILDFAVKAGCYDAADWIQRHRGEQPVPRPDATSRAEGEPRR